MSKAVEYFVSIFFSVFNLLVFSPLRSVSQEQKVDHMLLLTSYCIKIKKGKLLGISE